LRRLRACANGTASTVSSLDRIVGRSGGHSTCPVETFRKPLKTLELCQSLAELQMQRLQTVTLSMPTVTRALTHLPSIPSGCPHRKTSGSGSIRIGSGVAPTTCDEAVLHG
jgi:hypothetical protein